MGLENIKISIWSNNKNLQDFISKKRVFEEISFDKYKQGKNNDYLCIFLDLNNDLKEITSQLFEIYLDARENNQKIAIILLVSENNPQEKIKQIQNLLYPIEVNERIHRLIICQDLYFLDNDKPLTNLDKFVCGALTTKKIEVSKKGNFSFYPLSFLDLLEAVKTTLFLSNTNGKEFFLQGEELKDLSLAYQIKESLQEYQSQTLDIDNNLTSFQSKPNYSKDSLTATSQLNWKMKEDFTADLKSYVQNSSLLSPETKKPNKIGLFRKYLPQKKVPAELTEEGKNYKDELSKKLIYFIERAVAVLLLIYLTASIFFIFSSYGSLNYLEKTIFFLKKGDIGQSVKNLGYSNLASKIASTNYSFVAPVISFMSPDLNDSNTNFLSFLRFSHDTLFGLNQTYVLTETIYNSINSKEDKQDYTSLSLALKSNLQQSYESVNQIEILLNKGDLPKPLIQKIKQNLEYKQLVVIQEQIGEISNLVDFFPSLLGGKKTSNIFVLIQNNHEQRATGGIIDYVYQITLDQGRVVYQKLFLPQEIDKIDSFTLTPPPLIEKLTGDTVWRLRDMNYNPDFPQTATNIAWYLEKKLKIKPDFIIGLNSSSLERVLQKTQNWPEKISTTSPEDYSSKLKKSEGSAITKEIFEKLIDNGINKKTPLPQLAEIITNFFANGEVNLWSNSPELENGILSNDFSGAVYNYDCHPAMSSSRKCLSQTSYLNFSNFSQIPLNQYLQKTVIHTVTPQILSVDHLLQVEYKYQEVTPLLNRNLSEIVQLYIPKGSVLEQVFLDDQTVPLADMSFQEEKNLSRFQFILSSTLNQGHFLKIKYTVPLMERTILPIAFTFTDLKQPASNESNPVLEINIPEQSRASAITSEVTSSPTKIIYNQKKENSTFGVNFVPKQY